MRRQWKTLKPIISSTGLNSKQYLTVLDEKGNILLANARMQKDLNLKNPKQAKSNFFDLLHPVHIENLRKAFQYSMKSSSPYSMEFYIKNGRYHPMKWDVSYLPGNAKEAKAFLCKGSFTKAAPTIKKTSSVKNMSFGNIFGAFMENNLSMSWVVDEKNKLIYANPAFFEYFKFDKSALDKKITDLLPQAFAEKLISGIQQVFQSEQTTEFIENEKLPECGQVILQVKLFSLKDENGNKLIGCIANDDSKSYNAMQELDNANKRINLLHRVTTDAIWEWDYLSGKTILNDHLLALTGYPANEAMGQEWWISIIHPDDRERLINTLKEVSVKKLPSWEIDYRVLCADGEYKDIHDRGFVIYENGKSVKMIASLTDVTNEKLMENLMVEEKLHLQRQQAEIAIQVQERERTNIGRELHDNVNQILGASKLFMGMITPANDEEKEFKSKSVEYIVSAIEEIRKLSRELVSPQLKEKTLVNSIKSLIEDIHSTSEIKIKFTHDQENNLLSPGKKLTLYRIVQEQVKNILKYSKARKAEILLKSKGNNVELVIRDYGVGFDKKKINSGVGLTSINDRAKFYSGKVEIQSAPGKGCILTVSIPVLK